MDSIREEVKAGRIRKPEEIRAKLKQSIVDVLQPPGSSTELKMTGAKVCTSLVVGVNVENGGAGYTSAPAVSIGQSGAGMCANVVTFCVQTGDIGLNHGCLNTYVPYLQALAGGFA